MEHAQFQGTVPVYIQQNQQTGGAKFELYGFGSNEPLQCEFILFVTLVTRSSHGFLTFVLMFHLHSPASLVIYNVIRLKPDLSLTTTLVCLSSGVFFSATAFLIRYPYPLCECVCASVCV